MSKVPKYSWDEAHNRVNVQVMKNLTPQYVIDENCKRAQENFDRNVGLANDPKYQATLKMPLDLSDRYVKDIYETPPDGAVIYIINTSRPVN